MADTAQYQTLQAPAPTVYQPQPVSTLYPPAYDPPAGRPSFNADEDRRISRTPSPTPSEVEALSTSGGVNWKKLFVFNKRNIIIWAVIAFIITILVLSSVFHAQIVKALTPFVKWAKDTPAAFLIPIAVLVIISFPPLFGQEFVAIVCGMAWGAGVGFAIVSAGTLIGETINFIVFKYSCTKRSEKLVKTNIPYATMVKVINDGGLLIAIVARYSVLPAHYTTAVFASCGMRFYTFLIAAVVSLPTQFANVYIGTTYINDSPTGKTVNTVVLVLTIVITIAAQQIIKRKITQAKPGAIYARRKARQNEGAGFYSGRTHQADGSTIGLIQNSAPSGRQESYDPYVEPGYHSRNPSDSYVPRSHSRTPSENYAPYDGAHSRDNSEGRVQIPLATV